MIPRAPVHVSHDDPAALAGLPRREEALSDYLDGNREYEPGFMEASWDDASEALAVELGRLAVASATSRDGDFEDALEGELEDWEAMAVAGLDVGVAAAVMALNAAGCLTSTSCRGHPGMAGGGRNIPRIRFFAEPTRGSLVVESAVASGCGFEVDADGVGLIYAPSIEGTIALAEELLARRERFARGPESRLR